MTLTAHLILLLLALVCFALAALNVATGRINLTAAGLACGVLAVLVN